MRLHRIAAPFALLVGAQAGTDADSKDSLSHMIDKTNNLRTHSIAPPYVDSDLQNRWWDFGGDAIINTNKHIRLTQDKPSQRGWLWSRMPLSVLNWQVDIDFVVNGNAHNMYGDGFAIWLATDRAKVGSVFGSVDYFNGLGIFFDTYANSRHSYQWPRVTAMMGDGKTMYDHDHDNAEHEIAGCSENFRRRDFPTKARLTYLRNKHLQLKLQTRKPDEWVTCFEVDVSLPDAPFLGFSAATGDVMDNHDIISVNTYSVNIKQEYRDPNPYASRYAAGQGHGAQAATGGAAAAAVQAPMNPLGAGAQAQGQGKKSKRSKGKSSGAANVFLFILKAIGVLAFIAFTVAAYRTYNAKENSRRTW